MELFAMRSRFLFVAAALLLIYAEAAAQLSVASMRPARSSPRVIEYYGDSTVWGYKSGSGERVALPAPLAFSQALPHPEKFEVRNEGVNGATACDLLNGTDGKHRPWQEQMAMSPAQYVFINFAINDQWKHDLSTYRSCLRSLARIARQHGKRMIFETPNPTRDSGSTGLDVYVNAMREVASEEGVPVIDQYRYLTRLLAGRTPYTICPDGLHPSDEVYVLKGRYAAKVFSRLISAKEMR